MRRIFLLSPARANGKRVQYLTRAGAGFELARQVQIGDATLGEVFSFCSGLYFRGKLAYARRFAQPPEGINGVQIITPSRGLVAAEARVGLKELAEFALVDVAAMDVRFTAPLAESVRTLAETEYEVVLLGSIATGKYVDTLLPILGKRLLFPSEFVGRGDMSRGGLMLRCVSSEEELDYLPVEGAMRRGPRAMRINPRK